MHGELMLAEGKQLQVDVLYLVIPLEADVIDLIDILAAAITDRIRGCHW